MNQASDDTLIRVLGRLANWPMLPHTVHWMSVVMDKLRELQRISVLLNVAQSHTSMGIGDLPRGRGGGLWVDDGGRWWTVVVVVQWGQDSRR